MSGPLDVPGPELAVRCAACGAPAGEPCRDLSDTWLLDGRSHQGRIWQLEAWRNHWAAGGQPEQARPRVSVVVQGDLFAEVPSG